ncbi:MAG: hypothetical protein US30_C0004G0025 [Candidatus Moranbacteria bacterium GW2011_GWF2_36_839]|nr:MAG: hypothetical protein US27_C0002G0028 [Candidatus Moranbacteria bacterium GW2011_GWF1_36_78]KKQ17281.1 MAG: hypothetical protein US30_C0004G0025 [Candidatus Moranbacteria bacterium GW2011_GWF2_36_839]
MIAMPKPEKIIDITKEVLKPKKVALLVDSEESILKIREGVMLLWKERSKKIVSWVVLHTCDICKDPKGLDDILQEYTQMDIDVVTVVSDCDYVEIIISNLRHKCGNKKICVVPVVLGQSNQTKIFKDIISGNLPELKISEYEKAKRLAPYEIIEFFSNKI